MKILLLSLAVFLSVARAAHNDLTTIIALVIADTDVNGDGIISDMEFEQEFIAKWDTPPLDGIIEKHDFVQKWTHEYLDTHQDTSDFFDNLDKVPATGGDGRLTPEDLSENKTEMDTDGDDVITVAEFEAYIRLHHPCGQHAHAGC